MDDTTDSRPAEKGTRLRALAFGGGGFNTAVQLGVTHALLVARGVAPDYVAGLSAGAVTAAALAEILQAGEGRSEPERRNAQVDNFRKFLASFQELPGELLRSILPDTYEINASLPLEPIELPIHFDAERQGRDAANQTRAGLIRILNRLLEIRLPVSAIAVIVNRVLRFIAASEEPSRRKRIWRRLNNASRLWYLGYRFIIGLAPTFRSLAWAAIAGAPGEEKRRKAGRPAGKLIGRVRAARLWIWDALTVLLFIPAWLLVAPLTLCLFVWIYLRPPTSQRRRWGRRLLDRILEHYSIAGGLGNTYVLKQQLIRCFDVEYHGKPDIAAILDKALLYSTEPAHAEGPRKTLAVYQERHPRIVVAPVAAEVGSGDLKVLPHDVPVVDALLAATAAVPIFPAVKIESWVYKKDGASQKVFIDGRHVSAEPVGALLDLLGSDERLDDCAAVDVYPVSNLALDVNGSAPRAELSGILEVAARAYELQRFRDATIDQRLTQLYTKSLPDQGRARVKIGERYYVRAEMRAVGLERPIGIDREVVRRGSRLGLKDLVHEAVADGCRAALQAMIPGSIADAAGGAPSVSCGQVIGRRLESVQANPRLLGNLEGPPGLPEVCARCALTRTGSGDLKAEEQQKQLLKVLPRRQDWPEWPIEGQPPAPSAPVISPPAAPQITIDLPGWPHERAGLQGSARPLVNFLFGGGVFRGVFHMGVMNALNELGLEPDLVAGSSVGSIIAAMIAQAFNETADQRPGQIANLAATFLSIDQLVMTDRLADFFRGLTLRAADAPFSPRDLDLVLRRYDVDWSGGWSNRVRRVVGGLERFFYLSPVNLAALVKAGRERDIGQLSVLLHEAIQEFLDRGGVGQEILGTEPLALLIHHEVIRRLDWAANDKLFDAFQGRGIHFLATATNLSRGRLEILGSPESQSYASLLYGLLASSAFPGVFRPRESWEIFRNATDRDQYIDGGTIDNLPLDAVARFLDLASQAPNTLVARRPQAGGHAVPHLLFTASLEVDKACLPDHDVETIRRSFLRLRSRARTMSYNRKIDAYASVQRNLREIYNRRVSAETGAPPWQPLDLHVIAVRPRWLCNTFGFHPMLGFRRYRQAQSIAHGCASTLATFYDQTRKDGGRTWTDAWGVRGLETIDHEAVTSRVDSKRLGLNPKREGKPPGQCWFRSVPCPFSTQALASRADLAGRAPLVRELAKVYEVCGKPETHRPAHAVQNILE